MLFFFKKKKTILIDVQIFFRTRFYNINIESCCFRVNLQVRNDQKPIILLWLEKVTNFKLNKPLHSSAQPRAVMSLSFSSNFLTSIESSNRLSRKYFKCEDFFNTCENNLLTLCRYLQCEHVIKKDCTLYQYSKKGIIYKHNPTQGEENASLTYSSLLT